MRATRTFRALTNRNYRLYAIGQLVSLAGTSMQAVAQAWLVLDLSGSSTTLGLTMTLQFLPITLFGMSGGAFADRFDRRRLFIVVQGLGCIEAALLGILVASGNINLFLVNVFALALGLITAVEGPTKNTLVYDIAGPDDLTNAVSLGIAMQNLARVIGPAIAGILIAAFSVQVCFFVNAGSFLAVIATLVLMRMPRRSPAPDGDPAAASVTEALRFVIHHRQLRTILVSCGLMFAFAWEFEVTLPVLTKYTFGGQAGVLGALLAAQGLGAMAGALVVARQIAPGHSAFQLSALTFGLALAASAMAPTVRIEIVALFFCGAGGVALAALCTSLFQSHIPDRMRGRVMALWLVFAVGSRPVGAPVVGFVMQRFGPRYGPGLGAFVVLFALLPSWAYLARRGARIREGTARPVVTPMFDG